MNFFRRMKYYLNFLRSVMSIDVRLIWGMWKLTRLPQPAITVFGGSRIGLNEPIAQRATQLAKKLVQLGFSIITGGGPGIMEAANLGASQYIRECPVNGNCRPLVSAGIGLIHLNKERVNQYVQTSIIMEHFFSRKWLLVRYSVGYVIFPGGYGTLDELFEILTLVQTEKMPRYPIVLMGSDYWKPMIEWVNDRALAGGLIAIGDEKIFSVCDDVDEAVEIIRTWHNL